MQFLLPSYDTVLELHDLVLQSTGGLKGLPHPDNVHGAIGRPERFMFYDGKCTIHTVCAVLIDSLARNHAFADGNKRTALMTTLYTYVLNGHKLTYSWVMNTRYEELVLWVVEKHPTIPEIATRLEDLSNEFTQITMLERIKELLSPDHD